MKSRGGLGREVHLTSHLSSSLAFTFSRSLLLCTAPHYLNAWNRLRRRRLYQPLAYLIPEGKCYFFEGRGKGWGKTTSICTQSTRRSSKPSHSKPCDRHELLLNFQLVVNLSIHIIIKANLIRSFVRINFLDKIFFYRALWSSCSKK